MKFKILHALITDKTGSIISQLIENHGPEDIELFIYNFIMRFPHLDLTYLEEIFKDDKDNVIGMADDLYGMLVFTDHLDYKQYICSDWCEDEEE